MLLPLLLLLLSQGLVEQVAGVSQLVDVSQCSWQVEKERETTARIVAWRHLNIATSSTLECSLAGSDGPALNVRHKPTFSSLATLFSYLFRIYFHR